MNTTGNTLMSWKLGERVSGRYCRVPYTGVITSDSRNTPDYRNWIFEIDLEKPITVYGQQRKHISRCDEFQLRHCGTRLGKESR